MPGACAKFIASLIKSCDTIVSRSSRLVQYIPSSDALTLGPMYYKRLLNTVFKY